MPTNKLTAQNFEMYSGNNKPVMFDVIDQSNASVDVSGATGSLAVARHSGGPSLFSKAASIPGDPINRVSFEIQPADTEALRGNFYYEAQLVDQSGRVSTIAFGTITVLQNLIV